VRIAVTPPARAAEAGLVPQNVVDQHGRGLLSRNPRAFSAPTCRIHHDTFCRAGDDRIP
jgi:hypothetical protein